MEGPCSSIATIVTSMLIYVNLIKRIPRIPHYMTLNCFGIFLSCEVLFVTTPIENWTQTSILPATLPAIGSKHLLWALIHISQVFSSSFNLGWMWYHVVPKNHSRAVLVSRSAHSSLRTRRLRVEKCSPAVSLVTAPGSTVLRAVGNHVFFQGLSRLLSSNST